MSFELESVRTHKQFSVEKADLVRLLQRRELADLETLGNAHSIATKLGSDESKGISEDSTNYRKQTFGVNELPPPVSKTYFQFLFNAFKDTMIIVLCVAAVASMGAGIYKTLTGETTAWLEGTTIIAAILVVVNINAINDYRKQSQFRQLESARDKLRFVQVVRESETIRIPAKDLVVGDIVIIGTGDVLPCDGLVIEEHSLSLDESTMTGESDQITKSVQDDPFLLSGTTIIDGNGKMICLAVGVNSVNGQTLTALVAEPEETPLQRKLSKLAKIIAKIAGTCAAIILVVLLVHYFISGIGSGAGQIFEDVIDIVIIGIVVLVVAIPEGLPVAVALSLSYATINMLKDNNLVRHLNACETMGGATTICSDKTGTLTINKMTVVTALVGDKLYGRNEKVTNCSEDTLSNIAINSDAYEVKDAEGKDMFVGSKTDVALLLWINSLQKNYKEYRKNAQIITRIPFSSERKKMTTTIQTENGQIEYVKGASEQILSMCDLYIDESGNTAILTNEKKDSIDKTITEFAEERLRTICCAHKKGDASSYILSGLFGIEDPIRAEAAESVKKSKSAGIVVRMVTGDNVQTATSIARQCKIVENEDDLVMEGNEFRELPETERDAIIPRLRVLARSSPDDKMVLVKSLKRLGETVAVTGDGVNDAPALRASDVGFAMGIAGTETAKQAADIILMDDNFASLVKAISWGRNVRRGIQRFIQFQLTINISATTITVVTALYSAFVFGKPVSAFSALSGLYLNFVADSLAALALSTDHPTKDLLKQSPYRKSDHIISKQMRIMIAAQATYQIAVSLVLYFLGQSIFGWDNLRVRTVVFNTYMFMNIFNEVNCRSISKDRNIFRGIFKNKFFLPIFAVTLLLQIPIITFAGSVFGTTSLPLYLWGVSLIFGLLALPLGYVIRLGFSTEKRKVS